MAKSAAQRSREYRERHPDRERARQKRWREKNPDYMRNWFAARRASDPEFVERERGYARKADIKRRSNPARKRYLATQMSARLRGHHAMPETLQYSQVLASDPCAYCGASMEHVDHIVPFSRGGESDWTNLTPACRQCNLSKGATSMLSFLLRRVG